jgi:hypothetical protein
MAWNSSVIILSRYVLAASCCETPLNWGVLQGYYYRSALTTVIYGRISREQNSHQEHSPLSLTFET